MQTYLLLTPQELPHAAALRAPLVHMAYAVGEDGQLARAALPPSVRGGLLGLCDRCSQADLRPEPLCSQLLGECTARRFSGVAADFDRPPSADRLSFLARLAALLRRTGRALYVPEAYAVPSARILLNTAVSGGTLEGLLQEALDRYGAPRLALDAERLRMDFTLPCPAGIGRALTQAEFSALFARFGTPSFYAQELGARYFTYFADGHAHMVLYDDAETLLEKCRLAAKRGVGAAFFTYPEVADLLPALFAKSSPHR